MKKSLLIVAAVALLGIMAAYADPLGNVHRLSLLSSAGGSAPSPASQSAPSTQQPSSASTQQPAASGTTSSQSQSTTSGSSGTTTSPQYKDGNFQGQDSSGPYGDVQVTVSIQGGKITNVHFDQLTAYDSHSQEINDYAAPQLKQQTLSAQSAQIDGVSGATFTSTDYINSLQSALDKARA